MPGLEESFKLMAMEKRFSRPLLKGRYPGLTATRVAQKNGFGLSFGFDQGI